MRCSLCGCSPGKALAIDDGLYMLLCEACLYEMALEVQQEERSQQ